MFKLLPTISCLRSRLIFLVSHAQDTQTQFDLTHLSKNSNMHGLRNSDGKKVRYIAVPLSILISLSLSVSVAQQQQGAFVTQYGRARIKREVPPFLD